MGLGGTAALERGFVSCYKVKKLLWGRDGDGAGCSSYCNIFGPDKTSSIYERKGLERKRWPRFRNSSNPAKPPLRIYYLSGCHYIMGPPPLMQGSFNRMYFSPAERPFVNTPTVYNIRPSRLKGHFFPPLTIQPPLGALAVRTNSCNVNSPAIMPRVLRSVTNLSPRLVPRHAPCPFLKCLNCSRNRFL